MTKDSLLLSPSPLLCSGIYLILGGARSGKSRFAEQLVEQAKQPIYIATAQAKDSEMAQRIAAHRARRGKQWITIEEPIALAQILTRWNTEETAILVDCLTLWLSNLLCDDRNEENGAVSDLLTVLPKVTGTVVFVANEVGLGIVPDTPLARRFRDQAGRLNQEIATRADIVYFIAAGLPLMLKNRIE